MCNCSKSSTAGAAFSQKQLDEKRRASRGRGVPLGAANSLPANGPRLVRGVQRYPAPRK
jgi:hypothetical protein